MLHSYTAVQLDICHATTNFIRNQITYVQLVIISYYKKSTVQLCQRKVTLLLQDHNNYVFAKGLGCSPKSKMDQLNLLCI